MIQTRLVLAVTILLSILISMTVASSVPVNSRSLGLSARHIKGVASPRVLEQEESTSNVAAKSTKRMSKKSKKMSNKGKNKMKASKKGNKASKKGNRGPPSTQSPTSAPNYIEVNADVFQLYYNLTAPRQPSEEEYQELAQITSTYLEQYMTDVFGDGLQIFSTFQVFQGEYNDGEPVRVDYRSAGLFKEDLFPTPTTAELNNLISAAFSGPNLQNYLAYFNNLSSGNVFQTSDEVVQQRAAAEPETESASVGIVAGAAAAGALALIAGVACCVTRRKKKKKQGSDADNADKLNGEGSDAGTVRVEDSDAGEADDNSTVGLQRSAWFCPLAMW